MPTTQLTFKRTTGGVRFAITATSSLPKTGTRQLYHRPDTKKFCRQVVHGMLEKGRPHKEVRHGKLLLTFDAPTCTAPSPDFSAASA